MPSGVRIVAMEEACKIQLDSERILANAGNFCQPPPGASPLITDEILTLPEVAQLLKVAEKTVYTMAQKGELPAFKVGGQWRFRRTDLDAWIDAKTRRAAGEEDSK